MTIYLEGSIWIFEGLFGFANLLGVYLAQGSIWKKLIDGPNGIRYIFDLNQMYFESLIVLQVRKNNFIDIF